MYTCIACCSVCHARPTLLLTRVLTAHESVSLPPTLHSTPFSIHHICMTICPPPCADPTLTINNLRQVTASVMKWYDLGEDYGSLDVPHAVCDDINDNTAYKTEEEKKEALLLYYLLTMPMASWPSVAGALHRREEKTASQAVQVFLKATAAGQSSYRDYYHSYDAWLCRCSVELCTPSLSLSSSLFLSVCSQTQASLQRTFQVY